MKKLIRILSITLIILAFTGNVFAISNETFLNNYATTLIGCISIAIAMTFVYLNAVKEADKNAEKFQKEQMKKELEEKKNIEKSTKKIKTKTKGMTLVVLVITVIIMIIIAVSTVLSLEDTKMMKRGYVAKVTGILDNVQQKLSEKVADEVMKNKKEAQPTDVAFATFISRIGTSEYFKIDIEAMELPSTDLEGFFIIDNQFNAIYLENRDYIFPEDAEIPEEVFSILEM